MAMFQRPISAETRRARLRSGVTSAAVRPGVSKASRKMSAMTSASSPGCAASTSERPSRPDAIVARCRALQCARHASVVGAGRKVSRSRSSRACNVADGSLQSRTSRALDADAAEQIASCQIADGRDRVRPSFRRRASRSSPGSMTAAVRQMRDGGEQIRAVAGMLPVVPAAITGPRGGDAARAPRSASSSRLRRAAGSSLPSVRQNCRPHVAQEHEKIAHTRPNARRARQARALQAPRDRLPAFRLRREIAPARARKSDRLPEVGGAAVAARAPSVRQVWQAAIAGAAA